ncbi:MAG TPA: hypothetical protein VN749_09040 [Candidatus Eisenbacteria bacterium]|nr:hypothetical protein [Candidatus Eisenbacteria bacterium]
MRHVKDDALSGSRILILAILVAAPLLMTGLTSRISSSAKAAAPAKPDAHRLRTGHFTYRTMEHGKDVGKGQITIRQVADSGNYEFSGQFDFVEEFKDYPRQRWNSIATAELEPISATLTLDQAAGAAPVFDLKYGSGRVTGFFVGRKKNSDTKAGQSIDAALPANTFDQRIDWAAVLGSPLEVAQRFEFNVYDPGTGVSGVTVEVGYLERIQVPGGSFDAYRVVYRIKKRGKTEQYVVFASRELPRVMVREEFPNGSVDELIEMSGL